MIKLEGVNYKYKEGFEVLDINMSAENGEVVCLLGESGCGKSTILRLISGLEYGVTGRIEVGGKVVLDDEEFIPPEKRSIGFVFQYSALFPHKTVIENVMMGISSDKTKSEAIDIAHKSLKIVKLEGYDEYYPHMLSGGQQQRVNIARALAQDPKLILFDEPFSNLDTNLKREVKDNVIEYLRKNGITSIMVTHDSDEALEVSDKIYLLYEGKILQSGNTKEVYCNPVNYFIAQFFGELQCIGEKCIVENGLVKSVCGNIECKDYSDGTLVNVYMRDEALYVDKDGDIEVIVEEIRFVSCYVKIKKGFDKVYKVRIPLALSPDKGHTLNMSLDKRQVFVFKD